ncbi:MAG: class II aldolase/adducin family protein [Planctomycetota bacterium]|nr:class II aldolase/adducin family protein [Planctomycetota bacterium]
MNDYGNPGASGDTRGLFRPGQGHAHEPRQAHPEEEARLRKALCEIGRLCYDRNLIVGADGNLSARLSDDTILITPAGAMKGFMEPSHITKVDMEGRVLGGGARASTETGIHVTSYQARPEMRAVVHAHPPHAVAMTIAGIDLQMPVIPEVVVTIGGIPTAPYATPGTHELPDSIRELLRCSDTVMMKMHGSISLGTNLMDAFKKLDMLEHTAKILYLAHTLRGGLDPLPPEAVERLLQTRKLLGIDTKNTFETRCGL